MDHLTSTTVVQLMQKYGKTIRGLAKSMQIPMTRVRQVRADGVDGHANVRDWMEAITGNHNAGWDAVASAYI